MTLHSWITLWYSWITLWSPWITLWQHVCIQSSTQKFPISDTISSMEVVNDHKVVKRETGWMAVLLASLWWWW